MIDYRAGLMQRRVVPPGTVRLIDDRVEPRSFGSSVGGRALVDYRAGQRCLIDTRCMTMFSRVFSLSLSRWKYLGTE